jgi:hypothetical protein
MLKLNDADFTVGRTRFYDSLPGGGEPTAKIFVRIVPAGLGVSVLAQLDTGAAWSVLASELAGEMGLLDGSGEPSKLSTREGLKDGYLVRVPLIIPADEGQGESLEIEATFFVSGQWPQGKSFIGYSGFIEFIRIALDPQEHYFYFGY